MQEQNYKNHIRWYIPHHFILYPVLFLCAFTSGFLTYLYFRCHLPDNSVIWLAITVLIVILGLLSLMIRQHYALGNQNRIVRLELRLRYYILTQQRFEELESKLSFSQLAALRFASDEEFIQLADRAVKENLSGDAIKRSIKKWLPDEMRL